MSFGFEIEKKKSKKYGEGLIRTRIKKRFQVQGRRQELNSPIQQPMGHDVSSRLTLNVLP